MNDQTEEDQEMKGSRFITGRHVEMRPRCAVQLSSLIETSNFSPNRFNYELNYAFYTQLSSGYGAPAGRPGSSRCSGE